MNTNKLEPLAVVGGGVLVISVLIIMLALASGLIPTDGIPAGYTVGGTLISLSNPTLVERPSLGLSNSTVWQASIVYNGGNEQSVGYTYSTPNTLLQDASTRQKAVNYIVVNSGMTTQKMSYALVNEVSKQPQRYSLNYVPTTLIVGTSDVSYQCAWDLSDRDSIKYAANVYSKKSFSQTSLDAIYWPTTCRDDYIHICEAHNQGTFLTSTTANNFFGINTGYSTGYSCGKFVQNTSSRLNYYSALQPSTTFTVETKITNDKGQVETIYNSESQLAAKSVDNKVLVEILGTLDTFNQKAVNPADFEVVYQGSSKYIVTKSTFNALPTAPSTLISGQSLSSARTSLGNYNTYFDALVSTQQNLLLQATNYPDYQNAVFATNTSTGLPTLVLDRSNRPVAYPLSRITIVANFVGIYAPKATPEIAQVIPTSVQMKSGQQGKVTIVVRNTGDAGMARVSIPSCTPTSINWGAEQDLTLAHDETHGFDFYGSAQEGNYNCNIKVSNQDLSVIKTGTFGVSVSPTCTLVPQGNFQVDFTKCQLVCPLTSCPSGSTVDNSTCTCVSGGGSCTQDTTQVCPDGSSISTARCTGGKLYPTGNSCAGGDTNQTCPTGYHLETTTQRGIIESFLGMSGAVTTACVPDKFDLGKWLVDNILLIIIVIFGMIAVVAVAFMAFTMAQKKGKR